MEEEQRKYKTSTVLLSKKRYVYTICAHCDDTKEGAKSLFFYPMSNRISA